METNPLSKPCLVVREPRTVEELEALLRIRHTAFQKTELRFILHKNELGLDVDPWDKQAFHIGLYQQSETAIQPIGYMRYIHKQPKDSPLLFELGKRYPELNEAIVKIPPASHPGLSRIPQLVSPDTLHSIYDKIPEDLAENSRFALLDNENSPLACRFLMEAGTAISLYYHRLEIVFESAAHHARVYQRYGFQCLATYEYANLPFTTVLIHASQTHLEHKFQPRFRRMAEAFEQAKEVWFTRLNQNITSLEL